MKYRAEIDGLRAIAVVGVILYHAQFILSGNNWFQGGYIGVDIFFVISGYLISHIILSELLDKGGFDFLKFYERRARRILPMLFTVIIVSFPVAWLYLLPADFTEFGQSILSAIFFGSNFFFYYATTEYGADSALLKPFLHTWSLGIEEQFYIFFPVLALLLHKIFKDHILTVLAVLFLASLQFSQIMSDIDHELNFYWPLSRFWELLAGSMLAYIEIKYGRVAHSPLTQAMSIIGLYLIVSSFILLDGDAAHPGFITCLPVMGVMLIIAFSSGHDVVGKILGCRPFVAVGLISYSLYLWHFPIFAFGRMGGVSSDNMDKVIWIALTVIFAVISYFMIEQPFRKIAVVGRKAFVYSHLILFSLICGVAGYISIVQLDYKNLHHLAKMRPIINADQKAFMEQWYHYKKKGVMPFDVDSDLPRVLLVGDSTATDLYRSLSLVDNNDELYNLAIIQHENTRAMYQVICFHRYVMQGDYTCTNHKFTGEVREDFDIAFNQADVIALAANWEQGDIDVLPALISKLKEKGKRVIIVSNMPELSYKKSDRLMTPLSAFLLTHRRMPNIDELKDVEHEIYERTIANDEVFITNTELEMIAEEHEVIFLNRTYIMCNEEEQACDAITPNGDIIMFDLSHISYAASKYYGDNIIDKTHFMNFIRAR